MILSTPTLLSDPELKQLRLLMEHPGMPILLRHLRDHAAALAADAGNKLIVSTEENEEVNRADAIECAKQAQFHLAMVALLEKMSMKDFTWSKVQLSAKPRSE